MIINLWKNWTEQPVTVTFNGEGTSIEMIPFPAVTICTSQKIEKDKVDIEKMKKLMNSQGYISDGNSFHHLSIKE